MEDIWNTQDGTSVYNLCDAHTHAAILTIVVETDCVHTHQTMVQSTLYISLFTSPGPPTSLQLFGVVLGFYLSLFVCLFLFHFLIILSTYLSLGVPTLTLSCVLGSVCSYSHQWLFFFVVVLYLHIQYVSFAGWCSAPVQRVCGWMCVSACVGSCHWK